MTTPVTATIYYGQPVNFLGLTKGSGWVSSTAPTVYPASHYSTESCIASDQNPVPNSASSTNLGYVENLIIKDSTGAIPLDAQGNAMPVKYLDVVTISDSASNIWTQAAGTSPAPLLARGAGMGRVGSSLDCTLSQIEASPSNTANKPLTFMILPEYASNTPPGSAITGTYASEAATLTTAINSVYLYHSKSNPIALGGSNELILGGTKLPFEIFIAGSPPAPPGPNGGGGGGNGGGGGGTGGGGSTPASTPKYVYYILGGVAGLILLIVIFGAISNSKKKSTPSKS